MSAFGGKADMVRKRHQKQLNDALVIFNALKYRVRDE
jgi:hypothetical protein